MTTTAAASPIPRQPLIGKAELITRAFRKQDLGPLRQELVTRIEQDPGDANAMLDLSTVLLLEGRREQALAMQGHALQGQQLFHMPARQQPASLTLLALVGPGDFMANTPLEFLTAGSSINLYLLFLGPHLPAPKLLPAHDLVMCVIGETTQNRALLRELVGPLHAWHTPVLNRPEHVLKTSRDGLHAALRDAPGIMSPTLTRANRSALDDLARGAINLEDLLPGAAFPILVRPIDSNAGEGLSKIDAPAELKTYLASISEKDFFVSRFVDYRSADGLYRKYRVVLMRDKAYLAHLGISRRWMVHYLNADMADNAANRAEESRAMENFQQTFCAHHLPAFQVFHERIGLDYLVMDCGETSDGKLLVFEADTCGVVHDMDPEETYPYKKEHMRKIFAAFQAMAVAQAAGGAEFPASIENGS